MDIKPRGRTVKAGLNLQQMVELLLFLKAGKDLNRDGRPWCRLISCEIGREPRMDRGEVRYDFVVIVEVTPEMLLKGDDAHLGLYRILGIL